MPVNIQHISPSYVTRSLISKPYGTYIVRHLTEDDEIITAISFKHHSTQETFIYHYVVLSIRVDETIYTSHIQHYRLPYTEGNIQADVERILETYNRQEYPSRTSRFTPLTQEYTPVSDDGNWLLNEKQFYDIDFGKIPNPGQNNKGISTAIWKCDRQNDVKIFIKRFLKDDSYFKHELTLLKDLSHNSIITCYGQYSDKQYSYLVCENGGISLESRCPLKYRLMAEKMRFITNAGFQIANGMMYLEKKNIVHRDLTAGNVLINRYGYLRVADFGHAVKKEMGLNTLERSSKVNEQDHFQFRFLPPECLPDLKEKATSNMSTSIPSENIFANFTTKSDIWSFGILITQMFLKKPSKPYPEIDSLEMIPKYVKEDRKMHTQPDGCPLDVYRILQGCWNYDAKQRTTFEEMREQMFKFERIFHNGMK